MDFLNKKTYVIFVLLNMLIIITYSASAFGEEVFPVSAQDTIISIIPSKDVIAPGEEYSADIYVEPGVPINGVQLDLLFDSTRQSVLATDEGELFSDSHPTWFSSDTADESQGIISSIYDVILVEGTVSTAGTMAKITFKAGNTTGYTPLNLSDVVVSDANSTAASYRINDASMLIDTAPVMQSIGPLTVSETETLSFTAVATDADGDILTYTAEELPQGAILDGDSGTFIWTPEDGQEGTYVITFHVSDGYLQDSGNVEIIVDTINNPPVITDLSPAEETVFREGDVINIACDAHDPDGDALNYLIEVDGKALSNEANYVWETDYKSAGTHLIKVTVGDGTLESSITRTISILNEKPGRGNKKK